MAVESPVNILLRGSLTLSRSFLSRAWATISAALPRGHRMIGTVPAESRKRERVCVCEREIVERDLFTRGDKD